MSGRISLQLLLACAAVLPCGLHAAGPRGAEVKVGVLGTLDDILFAVGREKGFFRDEGLEVELVAIKGRAAAVVDALAARTVDVARAPYSFAFNERIRKSGMVMVADNAHNEKGRPRLGYFLVRADLAGELKSFRDLKGRRVGLPSPGGFEHLRLLRELDKAGLKESDLVGKAYAHHMLPGLFASKELDAGYFLEPQAGLLVKKGIAKVFAGSRLADEDYPNSMLYYSGKFRKDLPAARRFMKAYLRSIRAFRSMPREELSRLAEKTWGVPVEPEAFGILNISPDGAVNAPYVMAAQKEALKRGISSEEMKEEELFDMSFAAAAAKELDAAGPVR